MWFIKGKRDSQSPSGRRRVSKKLIQMNTPKDNLDAFEDEKNEERYREEHGIYTDRGQDIMDYEHYEDESEEEEEEEEKEEEKEEEEEEEKEKEE